MIEGILLDSRALKSLKISFFEVPTFSSSLDPMRRRIH